MRTRILCPLVLIAVSGVSIFGSLFPAPPRAAPPVAAIPPPPMPLCRFDGGAVFDKWTSATYAAVTYKTSCPDLAIDGCYYQVASTVYEWSPIWRKWVAVGHMDSGVVGPNCGEIETHTSLVDRTRLHVNSYCLSVTVWDRTFDDWQHMGTGYNYFTGNP